MLCKNQKKHNLHNTHAIQLHTHTGGGLLKTINSNHLYITHTLKNIPQKISQKH
nr:MAG TPA: hypothetical protein [Caudoviricetes sp.]